MKVIARPPHAADTATTQQRQHKSHLHTRARKTSISHELRMSFIFITYASSMNCLRISHIIHMKFMSLEFRLIFVYFMNFV